MDYYAIQVVTGGEERFIRLAGRMLAEPDEPEISYGRLLWPRKKLTIRRSGKQLASLAPVFPGYLFYESENLPPAVFRSFRKLTGFIKFLRSNRDITPLSGEDRALLLHFIAFGEIVDKSRAYFDENKRIRIAAGPLKGLEGRIVKVDKRKGRAKIRLSLYEKSFLIDLGFDLIEKADRADTRGTGESAGGGNEQGKA